MKKTIIFLIIQFSYYSLIFSQSEVAFKSIKVGMKDDQVEKILGLPVEIFRGFNEYNDLIKEVKTVGQSNYICWKYNKSKKTIVQVFDKEITKDSIVIDGIDTTIILNGEETIKPWEMKRIKGDTFYIYRERTYLRHLLLITKEEYESAMRSNLNKDHYCLIPIKSREIKIDTIMEIKPVVIGIEKYKCFIKSYKCVLFESSSVRVANVDYYPFKWDFEVKKYLK